MCYTEMNERNGPNRGSAFFPNSIQRSTVTRPRIIQDIVQSRALENEFHGELHEARRTRADDVAEMRVIHLAVYRSGPIELGVIEYVETFPPEFERFRLGDPQ